MGHDPKAFMNRGYLIVSAEQDCTVPFCDVDTWLMTNKDSLVSPLPLGFVLAEKDIVRLNGAIRANIDAAGLPVKSVEDGLDSGTLAARWALDALSNTTGLLGDARKSLAEIRMQHEVLQRNFVQAEAWLNDMLAPKFSLVREFPRGSGYIKLRADQVVRQALPCSGRGLAAVDIFSGVMDGNGACKLAVKLVRWNGDTITEFDTQQLSQKSGWLRLPLPQAVSGDDEDCILELQCISGDAEIGLALPVPFAHLHASTVDGEFAAPLALKIWGGLPGVALPKISHTHATLATDKATYLTAADLPTPNALVGSFTQIQDQGSYEIRPDSNGKALVVFSEISFGAFGDAEAFLQFFGDTGAIVTFAVTASGVIKSASDSYRLPQGSFLDEAQFARLADHAAFPNSDIVLRVENAHPGAAIKLWALKLSRDKK